MSSIQNSCFSSCCATSNSPEASCRLSGWLTLVLMIIVAGGSLLLGNHLSDTQDWSWLQEGAFNTEMQAVFATAGVVEIGLLLGYLCCGSKSGETGGIRGSNQPNNRVSSLPAVLPLPHYRSFENEITQLPGEVLVCFRHPIDTPSLPALFPYTFVARTPEWTFADLNMTDQAKYYFAVEKKNADGTWTWHRVEKSDKLSKWLPFGLIWALQIYWDLTPLFPNPPSS